MSRVMKFWRSRGRRFDGRRAGLKSVLYVPPPKKKEKEETMKKSGPIKEAFNRDGVAALHEFSLTMSNALVINSILGGKPKLSSGYTGFHAEEPEVLVKKWFPKYRQISRSMLWYRPKIMEEHPEYKEFDGHAAAFSLVSEDEETIILLAGDLDIDNTPEYRWKYDVNVESINSKEFERIRKLKSQLLDAEIIYQGEVNTLITDSNGRLCAERLSLFEEQIIEENYDARVVKDFREVVEEMQKEIPFGRLTIFSGPPGVGKSFLLRSMISELKDSLNVLIPSRMTGTLDSPELLNILLSWRGNQNAEEYITFFIEDADQCLAPRMSDNISVISSLLNLTDGLFGTALNLRIVATTNAEKPEFDEAMTRPGRLLKHIDVPRLTPEQALAAFRKLTDHETEFEGPTTLAEVYARAHGKEQEKRTKEPIGFSKLD